MFISDDRLSTRRTGMSKPVYSVTLCGVGVVCGLISCLLISGFASARGGMLSVGGGFTGGGELTGGVMRSGSSFVLASRMGDGLPAG